MEKSSKNDPKIILWLEKTKKTRQKQWEIQGFRKFSQCFLAKG